MKGLLLKDIYVMKKNLMISAVVCIYFLAGIIGLGAMTGEEGSDMSMVIYGVSLLLPCFLTANAMFIIDESPTKIETIYLHSMPVNKKMFVTEKFIVVYSLFAISYLLVGAQCLLNTVISDSDFTRKNLFIIIILASIIFIYLNLEIPLILRFGQAMATGCSIAFFVMVVVVGLIGMVKLSMNLKMGEMTEIIFNHKTLITCIVLAVDALVAFLSYKWAWAVLRKKI